MAITLPKIDIDMLEQKAVELLFKALEKLAPEQAVHKAVDELVKWLDDQISYGKGPMARMVDAYDHVILKFVLHMLVKRVYVELEESGAFEPDPDTEA